MFKILDYIDVYIKFFLYICVYLFQNIILGLSVKLYHHPMNAVYGVRNLRTVLIILDVYKTLTRKIYFSNVRSHKL